MKFGFDPFSWKSGITLILGAVSFYASTFLPPQSLLIDIVVRSLIISVIFIPVAVGLRLSDDAMEFLQALKKRFLN